jgi:acetyltransferase-like isoleucine patch superfamily enzyme
MMEPFDPESFAAFGPHSVLHQPVMSVVHPGGVHVGTWVNIGAFAIIEALVPDRGVTVHIGDNTYLGNFLRLTAVHSVTIGEECLISDRVYISDSGHVYEDVTQPIKRQGLRDGRRVEIADGAWIGIGAAIVGNVRIGRNAVVGANAVVRDDVPDFTVVAGNPAQVVRRHDGEEWRWTMGAGA